MAMAVLGATLCTVFMVTLVTAKPVCLNQGEDSPKSSESSESSSSEETATHGRSSQEPLQPDTPNAMEENNPLDTAPLPSADEGPSLAMPIPEDPQTSTDPDALQLLPDDPSHTAMDVNVALDVPGSEPAPTKDSLTSETMPNIPPNTDTPHPPALSETGVITGTNQPQVITTYHGSLQGVTPSFPTCVIQPTPMSFSTASPQVVPTGTTLNGGPVCFTFQVTTPEPDPPRGDSI